MEKRRLKTPARVYIRSRMAASHPIDSEIRDRLRKLAPNQQEFAKQLGRSQGWLNKYINGAGHATIDDVIRIGALLIGADAPRLTDTERRLLRAWRRLPAEHQEDALAFFERAYGRRRPRSGGRSGRTPRAASGKAPGTR